MTQRARQKFVELAEKRVNKTIKDIRLIGNLSNRSNYKYEESDVRAIFTVLERELKQARERFTSHLSDSTEKPFQLKP
jgi:hypothetical protein